MHVFCFLEFPTDSFLDISGVPGTGKTATVHSVVTELKRMAENNVSRVKIPFSCRNLIRYRKRIPSRLLKLMAFGYQNPQPRIIFSGKRYRGMT